MARDGDKPSERRRAERVPVNAEFNEAATTYVSDLSQTGVFVHTAQVLPVGTAITLRFTVLLDDPVSIVARGKVARRQTDPEGLGIAFVDLTPEMLLRIDDIVAHRRPRDLGPPLHKVVVDLPADASGKGTAVGRLKLERRRRGAAPAPDPDGTKVVPAPKSDPAFEESKTLTKLEAVDVEIIDEDPDGSRRGGKR
jgi:hypothetical protein